MSEEPSEKSLRRNPKNTSLSAGALKTGLRVAAKDALAPEQADTARREKAYLRPLSDESIRLVVKEPPMWEYRLYFQALKDFVEAAATEAEKAPSHPAITGTLNLANWMNERLNEYVSLGDRINRLVNTELHPAFGAPGEPGDAAAIIAVAKKVAQIYRRFLEIRSEARNQHEDHLLTETVREFAKICDGSIDELETYPTNSLNTLMDALADADGETEVVLRFDLTLKADTDPFHRALRKARQQM